MSNQKHVSPIIKTLARKITSEELSQVSGGAFNGGTSVQTSNAKDDGTQENTYNSGGKLTSLDTVHG
jgi:hypothetical protein